MGDRDRRRGRHLEPEPPQQHGEEQRPLDHREARAGADPRAPRERDEGVPRAGAARLGPPAARVEGVGRRARSARAGGGARARPRPACRRGTARPRNVSGRPSRAPSSAPADRAAAPRGSSPARRAGARRPRSPGVERAPPPPPPAPASRETRRGTRASRRAPRPRSRGPARKKMATWSTISSQPKRSPVTGSRVVMILVARSSGAVPAAMASARVARQVRRSGGGSRGPSRGSGASGSGASSAAAARRPRGSGSAGSAGGRGTRRRPRGAASSSMGIEKSVRKITSAAAWLASASISTSPRRRPSRSHGRLARGPHRREGLAQPPALEGRVDDPPLPLPGGAVGQEHRLAEQRPEPGADAVGLGEVAGPLVEDGADQRRVVDQHRAEEGRAELGHPGAVEPRGLGREDVGPEQPQVAPERDPVAAGPRAWAGSRRHRGVLGGRHVDPAARRRPARVAVAQRQRTGGDAEVVVVAGPVEGAEVLEVQAEELPAQRLPASRARACG